MLDPVHLLLVGYALGAVPSAEIGSVIIAGLAKRFGVSPKEVKAYDESVSGSED